MAAVRGKFRKLILAGYGSRGIVYLIIGVFALLAALGEGADVIGPEGALGWVLRTGFGSFLLFVIGIGLMCYAVWRMFQAAVDADNDGSDLKGIAVRIGYVASGGVHAVLGIWALTAATTGSGGDSGGKADLAAWLMQQPGGPWLVVLLGFAVAGAGIAQLYHGITRDFEDKIAAPESRMRLVRVVGIAGLSARGIIFLVIGGLFAFAGLTADPQQAGGIRSALEWLRGQTLGGTIFFLIAAGLVCFGCYSLFGALYRRVASA